MSHYIWGDTNEQLPPLGYVTDDESWRKLLPPGCTVIATKGHGSSLWSQAGRIDVRLANGSETSYFIKFTDKEIGKIMSEGEYHASVELYKYIPEYCPRPVGWGTYTSDENIHFFMCEFIEIAEDEFPPPEALCPVLATLHRSSQESDANPGRFGFHITTCNGTIENINTWCESWEEFFIQRMRNLFKLDERVHGPCAEYAGFEKALFEKVIPRLLRPMETGGNTLLPALIQGDVWQGNTATQCKPGGPMLIFDAASAWVHNEFEFTQWYAPRYMFGAEYREEYFRHFPPSEPKEDCADRGILYSLHADLISSILHTKATRYREFVIDTVRDLIAKYPDGYTGTCPRKGTQEVNGHA